MNRQNQEAIKNPLNVNNISIKRIISLLIPTFKEHLRLLAYSLTCLVYSSLFVWSENNNKKYIFSAMNKGYRVFYKKKSEFEWFIFFFLQTLRLFFCQGKSRL